MSTAWGICSSSPNELASRAAVARTSALSRDHASSSRDAQLPGDLLQREHDPLCLSGRGWCSRSESVAPIHDVSSQRIEDAEMAKTMETAVPERLRSRHRRAHLASDRRTGAHSRREVRMRQRRWIRRYWLAIMLVTVLAGLAAGFVHVFVWPPVAPYAIGALLASAGSPRSTSTSRARDPIQR